MYQFVAYTNKGAHIIVGRTQETKDIVCEMSWDEDTGDLRGLYIHPNHLDSDLEEKLWEEAEQFSKDSGVIFPRKESK